MRGVKTADGNEFRIENGRISDEHGTLVHARLAKPLVIMIGVPLTVYYYQTDEQGNTIIDHTGKPVVMTHNTAPVVY